MDLLVHSVKNNTVPLQEYLLQGSILETHRDALLHRLNGLCDLVSSATLGPEKFYDHEMVYTISHNFQSMPAAQPLSFRVRRAVDRPDLPWHLRYVGQPDVGDKTRHTLVRNCVDVGTSDNVVQFLEEMGFRLDFEYIVKGYLFTKGRMKVTVSRVYRILQPSLEQLEPVTSSYLVELSVVVNQGQDSIQEDIKNFAEQLKPLIIMDKLDHKRLQMSDR